jgi:hypothetical protein
MKKLISGLLFIPILINAQKTITISGYVQEFETGEKLVGASIYDFKSKKGTASNDYGFYSLSIPIDSVKLRVSFIGFENQIYELNPTEDVSLNISLTSQMLEEVEILSNKEEQVHLKAEMSTIDLSMDKVKALPALFGEKDIMKTIQLLPGVQTGSEGTSGLYVRGGGPDQNLILLDGVPVYNASHLFGFFSVFNADAIHSTKLIKGGFPARYGGRLSSVIDIKMKEGNMKKFHGEGAIGLISSKLTLEGPIVNDKTSFLISARRTYIDILAQPFIKMAQNRNNKPGENNSNNSGGYYFFDVNAKLNHKFSDKDRLFFSHYMGRDRAYLDNSDSYSRDSTSTVENTQAQLRWGNIISALRWNHMVTNKIFMNTTLRYSKYDFLIGADNSTANTTNGVTTNDGFSFAYTSGIEDWSGKIDFDYMLNPNHLIKFGIGDIYHTFTPGVNQFSLTNGNTAIDTTFGSQIHYAHEIAGYVEDEFKLNSKTKGNIGLHYTEFLVGNVRYPSLQPRFSIRYLLTENASLKASYASMTQFLHLLTNSGIGLPTDLWLPATESVKPQYSNQFAAGIAKTFLNKYELSLEGYYKTMENLIEYKDGASFFNTDQDWQTKIYAGRGWSYGGELMLEKKVGKTTGWIGYTLSWSNRQFDSINFGNVFPYRYDRRHDIGIAITHELNDNINIGLVWVYGTGNAVTLGQERYLSLFDTQVPSLADFNINQYSGIEHIEGRNNYRMPAYHRLDVSMNFKKEKKWGERTFSLGVYNAYSRQNPFYLEFTRNDNGNPQLSQYSLFPLIPSFNYAFKF